MKKLLFPLLVILLFTACQKQINTETIPGSKSKEKVSAGTNTPDGQIDICHREGNGSWHTITISINALPAHIAHGDMVPDGDGDGYTKVTPCGSGSQNDCDDNNANINPGATEVCDNNIDDNCNGQVDENCTPPVIICNQAWMSKNLNVDHYRNGDTIPQVTDPDEWASLTTGAWCYFNNDPAYEATYGKLYNWFAVNDPRGLAPSGWHVPTDEEWTTLGNCIYNMGPGGNVGGKMKETGTEHWQSPNRNATNLSGFTGLPAGCRESYGGFTGIWWYSYLWSSTESSSGGAWHRILQFYTGNMIRYNWSKNCGYSVRCIRD